MKKIIFSLLVIMVTFSVIVNSQDAYKVYRTTSYSLGGNLVNHSFWCADSTIVESWRDYINVCSSTTTAWLEDSITFWGRVSFIREDSVNSLALRVFLLAVTAVQKINFDKDIGITESEVLDQNTFWIKTVQKENILFRRKTSTSQILLFEIMIGNVLVNWMPQNQTGNIWSNKFKKTKKWEVDAKSFKADNGDVFSLPYDITNLIEAEKTLKSFLEK
ncbi:MAG: hypothetical protein NTW98_00545 [Candidatus Nomurabacteria bacterium]|nr:hypothetical protein [Candidatus Nomurabacteria bacterium]